MADEGKPVTRQRRRQKVEPHSVGNGDAGPLSSRLLSLRQLVLRSDWKQVTETLRDANSDSLSGVEFILNSALNAQQWDCISELAQHCSLEQRKLITEQAVKQGRWGDVKDLVKLGVGQDVRDDLFVKAVENGWKEVWMEALKHGVSSGSREQACESAARLGQWDLVHDLVQLGLSAEARSLVFKAAVGGQQVKCAVQLMKLGINRRDKGDTLREVMVGSHRNFLLELVRLAGDADLTDFVLGEAVKRSQWQLVEGLVQEGLGEMQMEGVCDQAVASQQWDLVFALLHRGVSPSEWIIDELFRNKMARHLVDQFADYAMPKGVKGLLLMGAVKHSDLDTALHIIHHQSLSDAEIMEAIKFAIHLLDAKVFMQLLKTSPRSRRVFKYNFHKQQWKKSLQPLKRGSDGGEVYWILQTLCKENEDDLALHVAVTQAEGGNGTSMEDFFHLKPEAAKLERRKIRLALGKLQEKDDYGFRLVVDFLCENSKEAASFFFRQALRMGDFFLALCLCKRGVHREDLKFALPWFLQNEDPYFISDVKEKLSGKELKWFLLYATRHGLTEYFREMSEPKLKNFMAFFKDCCVYVDDDFYRKVFRSSICRTVKHNAAECFAELCTEFFSHRYCVDRRSDHKEDFLFAFTRVIKKRKVELIKSACEKMFKKRRLSSREPLLRHLIDLVFESKAWRCMPSLGAGLRELDESERRSLLRFCLQKMLKNEVSWQKCTKALCQWMKEMDFGLLDSFSFTDSLRKDNVQEEWPTSVSSLAQWCVENSRSNLAVLLGVAQADWQLVTCALGKRDLDLHEGFLLQTAKSAAKKGAFSTGAAVLARCSPTRESLKFLWLPYNWEEMAAACQKEGLTDWAVGLSAFDMKSMKKKLQTCHNQVVLDHVMERAAFANEWEIVKQLSPGCSDYSVLLSTLRMAMEACQLQVAKALISRVDASTVVEKDTWSGWKTLLFMAVNRYSSKTGLALIHLCIASGLSTFQRDIHFVENRRTGDHNCPMLYALGIEKLPIISLMLRSGAVTNRRLHKIRNMRDMQSALRSRRLSDCWKQGYKMMIKAASNPSRLEHAARLVVSHSIGCRPGRPDRIQSLPVPNRIKDLIRFKDVLSCEPGNDPTMEVSDVYTGYPYFVKGSGSSEEECFMDEGSDMEF